MSFCLKVHTDSGAAVHCLWAKGQGLAYTKKTTSLLVSRTDQIHLLWHQLLQKSLQYQFISSILIFPFQQGNWNLYPQILSILLFYTVIIGDFCELKEKLQASCSTGNHVEEWYTLVLIGESGIVCTKLCRVSMLLQELFWIQKPWESIREVWLRTSSTYCTSNAQYSKKKSRPEIIVTRNRRGGNGYNQSRSGKGGRHVKRVDLARL